MKRVEFSLAAMTVALAAALAAACAATAGSAPDEQAGLALLRSGGHVILMRHANSPSGQLGPVGMTEGCTLAPGRGLDAKGFYQARSIGEFLRKENIAVARGYTSDLCRAWDTARLVAAGAPVEPVAALKTTEAQAIEAFKRRLAAELAAAPEANILLVTHSNIVPLYADWPAQPEIASGLVLIIDAASWRAVGQFDFVAPALE